MLEVDQKEMIFSLSPQEKINKAGCWHWQAFSAQEFLPQILSFELQAKSYEITCWSRGHGEFDDLPRRLFRRRDHLSRARGSAARADPSMMSE